MSHRIGVIDIGTNTILCLKAATEDGRIDIISDNRFHYRAGSRLDDAGNISREYKYSMKRALVTALATLEDCSQIRITATEVLRKPKDGAAFATQLSYDVGHSIEIITQNREAELGFKGATFGIEAPPDRYAVLDVGGGSSELAVGSRSKLRRWSGIRLGAVTATEAAGYERPVAAYSAIADAAFAESDFGRVLEPKPEVQYIIGGSAVTLAMVMAGLQRFELSEVMGFPLGKADLAVQLDRLVSLSLSERRKIMAFDAERADIIVSGGAIILSFMRNFSYDELRVSPNGLRHGLLLEIVSLRKA